MFVLNVSKHFFQMNINENNIIFPPFNNPISVVIVYVTRFSRNPLIAPPCIKLDPRFLLRASVVLINSFNSSVLRS
jgi:hypothetical protein